MRTPTSPLIEELQPMVVVPLSLLKQERMLSELIVLYILSFSLLHSVCPNNINVSVRYTNNNPSIFFSELSTAQLY